MNRKTALDTCRCRTRLDSKSRLQVVERSLTLSVGWGRDIEQTRKKEGKKRSFEKKTCPGGPTERKIAEGELRSGKIL